MNINSPTFKKTIGQYSHGYVIVNSVISILFIFNGIKYSQLPISITLVSLATSALILFLDTLTIFSDKKLKTYQAYLFIIILLLPTVYFLQILITKNTLDSIGRSSHAYLLNNIFFSLAWLIIGYSSAYTKYNKNNYIGIFILTGLTILFIQNSDFTFIIDYQELNKNAEVDAEPSHIPLGAWGALLIIYAYTIVSYRLKLIALIASLFIFYSMGGRGSLACFAASVFVYEALFKRDKLASQLILLLVFIVISTAAYIVENFDNSSPLLSRMFFEGGLNEDQSLSERIDQLYRGLALLFEQSLFGNANILIQEFGLLGAYIHNILSAWQFLGAPMFFTIIAILSSIALNFYKLRAYIETPIENFSLLIFLYSLICIMTVKFIFFPILWLSVGIGTATLLKLSKKSTT